MDTPKKQPPTDDILERLTDPDVLAGLLDGMEQKTQNIDAAALAAGIKSRVIGQDGVADDVAKQIRHRFARGDRTKPIGVFCFAGPPGVGKSYYAQVLAEKLYGSQQALQFFDMNMFSDAHAASALFGVAKGYVGFGTYGTLTRGLRDYPKSVILLDEFEKADSAVHKKFLTAWNNGFVTETSDGQKISTTDAIFILTVNAAADQIGQLAKTYANDRDKLVKTSKAALKEAGFAPEVLDRIDHVFAFRPLEGLDIAKVVGLEIESIIAGHKLELSKGGIDPNILARYIQRSKENEIGLRRLTKVIEDEIAETLIQARQNGAKSIRLLDSPDGICAEIATYHQKP